jgi:alanyl-tRNA synthetase
MKVQEIRECFSNYFINKGHEKVSSSPLVPLNDETLLFANAGMNQFKDYFTGSVTPENKKAVTIQKVVRAGGKHNDLENVGLTARHHTFFEMLGNFSFGDYFKEEAIGMAWSFLTQELKIPMDKLYVTVHHSDQEAYDIWQKSVGVPKDRIFKKGDKDNFWEMGDTGPCGPCSEIFYDHGEKYATPDFVPTKEQDLLDDEQRYVEVWNLVFMQFEKDGKGGRKKLPNPSIDTGMGLERIAAVLQGVYWNYDTDVFTSIISQIEKASGHSYQDKESQSSIRIVADHIRSCTMLITDGVIPSNEGRGYVLRRIIRRAVRHMRNLGAPKGSFCQLADVVLKELGTEYPQNKANQSLAEKLLKLEEDKFLETLDQGLKYLEEAIKKDMKGDTLDGSKAFMLYDTYGFPLDLTEVILNERNLKLDHAGFEKAMNERKEDSKKSWKGATQVDDQVFFTAKEKCGETQFNGYNQLMSQSKLLEVIDLGDTKGLVFNQTPFYAESGGQAGDKGIITSEDSEFEVYDTQKPVDGLFVHFTKSKGKLSVGENYTLSVNENNRNLTTRNHSATHLLQAALIKILGDHVKQSGSMVTSNRLRFDFTHMQAVTNDEIEEIESLVNREIMKSHPVTATETSMEDALSRGALALFGEKYGDDVRVLEMGGFSTELCGGTHVNKTSDIGLFTIISESSLSTGVRRIEATTSINAIHHLKKRSNILSQIELITSSKEEKVPKKIEALYADVKKVQKEIDKLKNEITAAKSEDLFANPELLNGKVAYKYAQAPEGSDLRKLSDSYMDKNPHGVVLITCKSGDKVSVLLRGPKKSNIACNAIFKSSIDIIDGRGGGRPDMAQGSGSAKNLDAFVEKIRSLISESI